MADVSGRDRGQLILVAALALALLFVGLALVLNSAIFTENLATRSDQTGASDALTYRSSTAATAGAGVEHTNRLAYTSSYAAFPDDLDTNLTNSTAAMRRDAARNARLVSAERAGPIVRGTKVAQDDGTTFEPQNVNVTGLGDIVINVSHWQVAGNVNDGRAFRMDVETSSLATFSQGDAEDYLLNLDNADPDSYASGSPPFTVAYDDEGGNIPDHAFAVYRADTDPSDVKITHANLDTNEVDTCTLEDAPPTFRVDVSGYRVVGDQGDCRSVLDFFGELEGPYDMYYAMGDQARGDYSIVIKQEYANFKGNVTTLTNGVTGTSYHFPDDGDPRTGAYVSAAVYAVDVDLVYRAEAVEYVSTVRVAPGEPDP